MQTFVYIGHGTNKGSNMIFKASLNHPRCPFIALLLMNVAQIVSALHVCNHLIAGIKVMNHYLERKYALFIKIT